ncbi:MAG: hypothetical protein JW987_07395 [Anaerolineaceae bacterium]|nr:hypothetical protein [Anaerolineaceae bacterium]
MNALRNLWQRFFPAYEPLPAGIYHFTAPPDSDFPYRLHLRLEKNGSGLLIANGSTVLHLNQTAAEYAYHLIRQSPAEEVARSVSRRYGIPTAQAQEDYTGFTDRIQTLLDIPDLDPVTYLVFDRQEPYTDLTAPFRLDCAVTYRQIDMDASPFAPVERVKRELSLEEWQSVLSKAWEAGIPHAVFTGGEPTLRTDLPELIAYAEKLGMVTGLITDGLRLADANYLNSVLQAGLDHLMMLLVPNDEKSWEAIRAALAEDIFVVVHLTLTQAEAANGNSILERLAGMGVMSLSLSANNPVVGAELPALRQQAADLGLRLVWDLPVPYSVRNPVALELAAEDQPLPEGAGSAWLYVEPDGDVLAAQGRPQVLGNLLTDPWDTIWSNPAK